MKKILFFICTLDDGGAQRVISILSNKLVEKGFQVTILKYYKSNNIYPLSSEVKVISVEENTKTRNIIKNIAWISKFFKNNCDVIISFLASYNMLAILANVSKKPIIVADRNDPNKVPTNKWFRTIRDILYKRADYVVVQTNANKLYFNLENCVVIKNPISMDDYIGKALVTKKENLIVTVGRLTKQKNQTMLIEAFANLKDKYNDYKLIVYGDDDNYKDVLVNKAKECNVEDKIVFAGSVKDVLDRIMSSQLFVLSSDYEGMSNALIEAMCLGLPVISTKVSGSDDLIIDGDNGFLINVGDKEELQKKIDYLLSNKEQRELLGRNATRIYCELKVDKIVNNWIELINKL